MLSYLCHMVESKGTLALHVVVSSILKGIVGADQSLESPVSETTLS